MVTYEEAFLGLCSAPAGYRDSPEAAEVDDDDGPYIHMIYLVQYLLRRLHEGDGSALERAADQAEMILANGDEQAVNLATFGFLEDLTNAHFWGANQSASDLLQRLGPLARQTPSGLELARMGDFRK